MEDTNKVSLLQIRVAEMRLFLYGENHSKVTINLEHYRQQNIVIVVQIKTNILNIDSVA